MAPKKLRKSIMVVNKQLFPQTPLELIQYKQAFADGVLFPRAWLPSEYLGRRKKILHYETAKWHSRAVWNSIWCHYCNGSSWFLHKTLQGTSKTSSVIKTTCVFSSDTVLLVTEDQLPGSDSQVAQSTLESVWTHWVDNGGLWHIQTSSYNAVFPVRSSRTTDPGHYHDIWVAAANI